MITTLLRRIGALLLCVCATSASAGALDAAIIISDGSPGRELLALRVDAMFQDAGFPKVHRLRMPSPGKLEDVFSKIRGGATHRDLFVFILADVSTSASGPQVAYGTTSVTSSFLRGQLDATAPLQSGRQIVFHDGTGVSAFLGGLANPQYKLGERVLFGSSDNVRDNSDRSDSYTNLLITNEFTVPGQNLMHQLNQISSDVGFLQGHAAVSRTEFSDADGDGVTNIYNDWRYANVKIQYDAPIADGTQVADKALIIGQNRPQDALSGAFFRNGTGLSHALYRLHVDESAILWLGEPLSGTSYLPIADYPTSLASVRGALNSHFVNTNDALIHISGHGQNGFVGLATTTADFLYYDELAAYMIAIQSQITGRLTVVVDTCYPDLIQRFAAKVAAAPAGAFPNGYPIIVMSAAPSTVSSAFAGGKYSFTSRWLDRIAFGGTISDANAYVDRAFVREIQRTQLDADADGIANEPEDFAAANRKVFLP